MSEVNEVVNESPAVSGINTFISMVMVIVMVMVVVMVMTIVVVMI